MIVLQKTTQNGCFLGFLARKTIKIGCFCQKQSKMVVYLISISYFCSRKQSTTYNKMRGVITGDIVGSSQIKTEYRERLLNCLNTMEKELQCVSPFRMELFRGDSFQLLVDDPAAAAKVAILLRAGLINHTPNQGKGIWDAKISLGIGNVEFLSDNIVTSDGEAFQYSGRQLDLMGKHRLTIKTPWQDVNDELEVSTAFVDDIITGWSSKQAGMIYLSLKQDAPKKEVAEHIGTSVQNVRNVLSSAREPLIRMYLERYCTVITDHLSKQ
jgi:hypothetical protein